MTPTSTRGQTPPPANRVRLVMEIGGVPYSVRFVPSDQLPPGASRGLTLTRIDPRRGRVAYSIFDGFEGPACSCPDHQFRRSHQGTCKHLAAARACGLL